MHPSYPSIISIDHEANSRLYEPSYNTYSSYPEYTTASKLEAFDYNYWPTATTTRNILSIPPSTANTIGDPIPIPSSTSQTIETLVPVPAVHLSQINSRTTISATHHHHHIHQHLYPTTPASNEPTNWLSSNEYESPTPYRHYSYPHNNFYDQSQWTTPTPALPIKYESPCSPPSYLESSHHFDQQLSDSKEELSDPSYSKYQEQQVNWLKPQLPPIPPKNPTNGMSHSYSFRLTFKYERRSKRALN